MPTWTASPTKTFLNELLNLPRNVSRRVPRIIEILENDPISAQGDARKLRQYENVYRVRIGDYRLIYSFGQGWVKLLSIRHRRDVYEGKRRDNFETPPLPNPSDLEPVLTQPTSSYVAVLPSIDLPATVLSSSITTALPYELTQSLLRQWHIPEEYWSKLLSIQNADALLDLPIPHEFIHRILDILFPSFIEELAAQPEYLLREPEDLDRFVEGNLIDFLLKLDPNQEKLKNLESNQPILITGGPGSGKSTIALYRVQKLVELGYQPILFTTYTNTLVKYSEQLLEQLLGRPAQQARVKVATADSIALRYYAEDYGEPTFATHNQCLGCLQRAIEITDIPGEVQQKLEELGISYLLEEILDVIEARGLTREEYLVKIRRGRLIRLRRNIREAIWVIYQTWQERMAANGYVTWEQLRRKALEVVTQLPQKPYQALIIDEAQDLSPVSLRLLLALVSSFQNVYLTADASQSIYQRGFSWTQVEADLQVRGRGIIKRNYRNTQQIATACETILHGTDAGDERCIKQKPSAYQGDPPTLLLVDNREQEIQAIREFFTMAARQFHLPLHSSAILCRTQQLCQEITQRLTQAGMKAEFVEGKMFDLNKPYIKVLTLHSAKGLEFPFVVVMGLTEGSLPFIDRNTPTEEEPAAINEERRLFYVGCSRAMRALMVCGSRSKPSIFLDSLCPPDWQRQELP